MSVCYRCPAILIVVGDLGSVQREIVESLRDGEENGYSLSKKIGRDQSGVNTCLHGLMRRGIVQIVRTEPNEKGVSRNIWGLTAFGGVVAARLPEVQNDL